jgi:Tfp pilus assembly protein FimT
MSNVPNKAAGFTILELAVVVLISGVVIAIATPKITNAMREYRVNIAMRQMVDTLNRVKAQAVSDNRRSAMMIDTANNRVGMATLTFDTPSSLWVVNTVTYAPLPQGVTFQRPTASPTGVTSTLVTSFPSYGGSSTVFRQDFTTRGFPVTALGTDVLSIFVGNGKTYRAITMSSVGGIRTYLTTSLVSSWADTRY